MSADYFLDPNTLGYAFDQKALQIQHDRSIGHLRIINPFFAEL